MKQTLFKPISQIKDLHNDWVLAYGESYGAACGIACGLNW